MARMIMSASSSELYPAHKRPSPYNSQCGVLKRLKVVRDEDEEENEREEEPNLYNDEMEANALHISISSLAAVLQSMKAHHTSHPQPRTPSVASRTDTSQTEKKL